MHENYQRDFIDVKKFYDRISDRRKNMSKIFLLRNLNKLGKKRESQLQSQVTEKLFENYFAMAYCCVYEDDSGTSKNRMLYRKEVKCLWCDCLFESNSNVNPGDINSSGWHQSRQLSISALLLHLKHCHLHFRYHSVRDKNGNLLVLVKRDRDLDGEDVLNRNPINEKIERKCRKLLFNFDIPLCKPLPFSKSCQDEESPLKMRRQFYRSQTGMPLVPEELPYIAEVNNFASLMKANKIIDEYADVTYEEKEMKKLWNIHISNYPPFGDGYFGVLCKLFVDRFASVIAKKNLRYQVLLHFITCYNFGLLLDDEIVLYMAVVDREKMKDEGK